MFTRKLFEAVAKIIRESDNVEKVTRRMADLFEKENPAFDRKRFLEACK